MGWQRRERKEKRRYTKITEFGKRFALLKFQDKKDEVKNALDLKSCSECKK